MAAFGLFLTNPYNITRGIVQFAGCVINDYADRKLDGKVAVVTGDAEIGAAFSSLPFTWNRSSNSPLRVNHPLGLR